MTGPKLYLVGHTTKPLLKMSKQELQKRVAWTEDMLDWMIAFWEEKAKEATKRYGPDNMQRGYVDGMQTALRFLKDGPEGIDKL